MGNLSQILIITDRKQVFGEDTDMITVLSLTSAHGGTATLIDALEECKKYGMKQLDYYPCFVRTVTRAFVRADVDDDEPGMGIMPYSTDAEKGMSLLESRPDLCVLLYSEQPFVPVIDLTGHECGGGDEPMLYLMPRSTDYCKYSAPTDSDIYPLTDEGLTQAIDRLMWANTK